MRILLVGAPHLCLVLLASSPQQCAIKLPVELRYARLQHLPVVQLSQGACMVQVLDVVQQRCEVGQHQRQLVWAGGCEALRGLCRGARAGGNV